MITAKLVKRMVPHISACLVAASAGGWFAQPVHAQYRPGRISFDLGTGFFQGKGGGRLVERNGFAIASQLSGTVFRKQSTALLVALNLSGFAILENTNDCVVPIPVDPDEAPASRCLGNFPSGLAIGALVGVEQRFGGKAAIRIFAGPAGFNAGSLPSGVGVQTRADLAVPANAHVAFVVWGQNGLMPVKNKPRLRVPMFGIGMRIQ